MSLLKHCADGNLAGIQAALSNKRTRRDRVQVRDNHNWTCLHHAVRSGNLECIKYLLTVKGLDTSAETFEGETALHIACSMPDVPLEVVITLIDANPDLINFVNNEEVDLLKCAIVRGRLDIVKVLVANGCEVNKKDLDGDTSLHIAAIELKLDIMRYLLYNTECDATIRNDGGKAACVILFARLLAKLSTSPPVLPEEVACFEEMTQFTFNLLDINSATRTELEDLNQMIILLYYYDQPKSSLYTKILKSFYVPPVKQYFFDKILQSNVSGCHCLITGLLADINTDNFYQKFELWSKFLQELYSLFVANEPFFHEYISEFMSSGWKYSEKCHGTYHVRAFWDYIRQTEEPLEPQKLFTFLKALILYDVDFSIFVGDGTLILPKEMFGVLMSLVNFVIPFNRPDMSFYCNYNFNESENMFHDMERLADPFIGLEVASLKNICRMSVRRYYFQTYSHYDALKALYSLEVPMQIRNFVCYNLSNFKF